MPAQKGEKGRRPFDFYETPPHYTRALVTHYGGFITGNICDPCVGKGNIVTQLRLRPSKVTTNDLDPKRRADTHDDAGRRQFWRRACGGVKFDWTITNPPFAQELPILRLARQHSRFVAMLARLSFLEPTHGRAGFWTRYADALTVIVLPRYSFRDNDDGKRQTDMMTCCWLVFGPESMAGRIIISTDRDLA